MNAWSFNPLKIGSYCNGDDAFLNRIKFVSIPLKSGHIVMTIMNGQCLMVSVSIPLKSGHIVIAKLAYI